uniref:Uncharacterized protein n=1 Tax=Percolomonas cosmopolitus TaxID=63605 RepID=A0A7S1KQX6_9EUKA|mmetsp:Transcript_4943/g.18604  ORF Transcript_4943/g.18604 Transcript_4943/m.18604 type:complete len:1243 (+) Transcript_4943:310-4038(+)|eukprot:CAMPEP_0117451680 /NCGR_PEP_ID=MMETSP0759-20121206/9144_1 /TAXON_ID=63605 /ORGANISM="Percolomonas cosmopolitus, Strain WS" /LENGTH=1242 /DNA_ID=CAMNT_0005244311 /DNA_START=278 /DNA_END=4006 /DNA_ORIENTATION=-
MNASLGDSGQSILSTSSIPQQQMFQYPSSSPLQQSVKGDGITTTTTNAFLPPAAPQPTVSSDYTSPSHLLKILTNLKKQGCTPDSNPRYAYLLRYLKYLTNDDAKKVNSTVSQSGAKKDTGGVSSSHMAQIKSQIYFSNASADRKSTTNLPPLAESLKGRRSTLEYERSVNGTVCITENADQSILEDRVFSDYAPGEERTIHNREKEWLRLCVAQRFDELANLYNGKAPIVGGYVDQLVSNHTQAPFVERLHSAIELKKLALLPLQRKVRQDLIANVKPSEERFTDDAKFQSAFVEKKKVHVKQPQKLSLTSQVMQRRNEMLESSRETEDIVKHLNKELSKFWDNKRKEEANERELYKQQRLDALRGNNEEAYYKLLQQDENQQRLMELLRQTDECLKALGAQLVQNRTVTTSSAPASDENAYISADLNDIEQETEMQVVEENTDDEGGRQNIYQKFMQNQNSYYKIAHRTRERVDKQPTSLQFGNLKPYQLKGLQWLVSLYNNKLNGILADEMGLGKTIQTISLIAYLQEFKNNEGPHLIIVPLGTLQNWANEFQRWAPHLTVVVYSGHSDERKKLNKKYIRTGKFNVVLTQYEYITRDHRVLKKPKWSYIIMDEGHRIKNAKCKLVLTLEKYYVSGHRLLLTGTPLQNDLKELWSLLHFLLPNVFESVESFESWFNMPFNQKNKRSMNEEEVLLVVTRLHQVLRPFLLRRVKDDVLNQLPEKVEHIIYCDISAMQKKMYTQLANNCRILINNGGAVKAKSLNNSVMQLRKVANHPYLFLQEYSIDENVIRASGKFAILDNIMYKLKQTGHRILLFSQMTQTLDILEDFCKFRDYTHLRLDGNVKAAERGPLLDEFNKKDSPYFIFLLSTRAGGLGLNLQTADTVILFDSDWNPQQDLQAMARAHRIGQTKSVRVFTFCTITPVEEKILARAQEKRTTEMQVIGAGKFNENSTQRERQNLLQQLISQKSEFKLDKVPNSEQFNRLIARGDEEVELFQKIDKLREKQHEEYFGELGYDPIPPALMSEVELPDWLRNSADSITEDKNEAVDEENNREKRKAKRHYFTDLTEDQFDKFLDGEITYESLRVGQDVHGNTDDSVKRKRDGLDDGEEVGEDMEDDGESSARKRKRVRTLSPLQEEMLVLLNRLLAMENPQTGDRLALYFIELPDRISFADYYNLIENPISFSEIQEKIESGSYESWQDMDADLQLLVQNCKTYNLPGTPICGDADAIYAEFRRECPE